jgi:hypothetical protein
MTKDAFYFSHDSNAKDDPKIMMLIDDLGLEGYGIFWVIIELLRCQEDYKLHLGLMKSIARKYNTTEIKIKQVVTSYNLFVINEDGYFYSMSLNKRMNKMNELRKKRSDAGKKGNTVRWSNESQSDNKAIAEQSQSIAIKQNKTKQKETKQKKENNNKIENENVTMFEDVTDGKKEDPVVVDNKYLIKLILDFKKKYKCVLGIEKLKELYIDKGKDKLEFYYRNFDIFINASHKKIDNVGGLYLYLVKNECSLPKSVEAKNDKPIQSQNYEQRKYDDEFWKEYEKDIQYIE